MSAGPYRGPVDYIVAALLLFTRSTLGGWATVLGSIFVVRLWVPLPGPSRVEWVLAIIVGLVFVGLFLKLLDGYVRRENQKHPPSDEERRQIDAEAAAKLDDRW